MYTRILPPQIQCESRDSLYFGKYEYVVSLHINEAWLLRNPSRTMVLERMRKRDQYHLSVSGQALTSELTKENLMHAVDILETLHSTFIHRTYGHNTFHVYTNDLRDVKILHKNYPMESTAKQAAVVYPSGVVMLATEPKYPYRTYFREKNLPIVKKQALWKWISNQTPDLVASPVTEKWFGGPSKVTNPFGYGWSGASSDWCRGHYFVEHTDLSHITMLAMVCPGLTRKTVQVQKRP
jgi:hypothetical protein